MGKQPSRNQPNTSRSRKQELRDTKREEARLAAERDAKRKRQLTIIGAIAGVALVAVIALILLTRDDTETDTAPPIAAAPAPLTVPNSGLTLGNPDAPVKLVEYGDYQCPACGAFAEDGFHNLVNEQIASGQVSFTYVPMSFLGDESVRAAEAALCANEQGQFWAMHESIFNNQFGENKGAFSRSRLDRMAEAINLDMNAFKSCMDDGKQRGAVTNYANTAQQDGVSSTPTFIINNGEPFGWNNWQAFSDTVNAALGG
jgi:protein-disulfide isomerase